MDAVLFTFSLTNCCSVFLIRWLLLVEAFRSNIWDVLEIQNLKNTLMFVVTFTVTRCKQLTITLTVKSWNSSQYLH